MRKVASILAVLALVFAANVSAHQHKAPHKGTLVEFGEEFAHLELVLDQATGKISAWVLDGEAEKAVRVAQKRSDRVAGGQFKICPDRIRHQKAQRIFLRKPPNRGRRGGLDPRSEKNIDRHHRGGKQTQAPFG